MKYIDIHAHLNFKDFDQDRSDIIARCKENDLGVINIGTCFKTSKEIIELANQNNQMWAIIGLHPIYTPEEPKFASEEFQNLIDRDRESEQNKIVGIGECGLDYFHLKGETEEEILAEKKVQEQAFRGQIEFAIKNDLPIMIHCRDAYDDVLNIIKEYKKTDGEKLRGNCHFFAGTIDQADEFLELGFTISFTGVITFAKDYEKLVEFVPLEKMHAETDCPYVAPAKFRGQRNEPIYSIEVVKKIAEIKGLDVKEVREQLVENAKKLFCF